MEITALRATCGAVTSSDLGPGTVDRAEGVAGRRARDDGEDVRRVAWGGVGAGALPGARALARWALALFSSRRRSDPGVGGRRPRRVRGSTAGTLGAPTRAWRRRGRVRYGCGRGCPRPGPAAVRRPRRHPWRCRGAAGVPSNDAGGSRDVRGKSPGDASTRDVPTSLRPPRARSRAHPRARAAPTPRRTIPGCSRSRRQRRAGPTARFGDRILRQTSVSDARYLCVRHGRPRRAPSPRASPPRPPPRPPPSPRAAKEAEKDKKIPSLRDFKTDLQAKVSAARDANKEKEKKKAAAAEAKGSAQPQQTQPAADPTRGRPNAGDLGGEGSETTDGPPRARAAESAPDAIPADVEPVATPDATRGTPRGRSRPRDAIGHHDGRTATAPNPRERHAAPRRRRCGDARPDETGARSAHDASAASSGSDSTRP